MRIPPNGELFFDTPPVLGAPPSHFAACLNAHGLYSTKQFVMRLSPRFTNCWNMFLLAFLAAGIL